MARVVVLRHILPDGSAHLDLMLERDAPAVERRLLTWRIESGVDIAAAPSFDGERLPDHRAAYLDHEGPIPAPGPEGAADNRPNAGAVRRVLAGTCRIVEESEARVVAEVEVGGASSRLIARRTGREPNRHWHFLRG